MTKKEFVSEYLKKHSGTGKKVFPDDFATLSSTKTVVLPYKSLIIGNEFFGKIELHTTEGNSVYQAEDIFEAKYIVYFKKYFSSSIKIPVKAEDVKEAVVKYEQYLDSILADIKDQLEYHSINPASLRSIRNEIFKRLNLVRY